MGKNDDQTSGVEEVQVFELTMDNSEDQDELNRRFHKPGGADDSLPAKIGRPVQGDSTTESAGRKKEAS